MSKGLLFWILMILWLLFGLWTHWPITGYSAIGNMFLLFILFAILGWQVFGPPVKG